MSSQPPTLQLYPPPPSPPAAPAIPEIRVPVVDDPVLLPIHPLTTVQVLHVINGEHYSGAERVQDLLAVRLPDEGVKADLVAIKPGKFGEVRRSSSRLTLLPMRGRFDLRVVGKLKQLVRRHQYQVLHAHTPRTALVTAMVARSLGLPWVYHVHSPVSRDSERRWQNWINTKVERFCLSSASRVVVVSPSLESYMHEQGVSEERIVCIPNGVPATDIQRPAVPVASPMVVGMVALFRPRKGTEVLLEGIHRARNEGKDLRLRLIGGFETPEYEQQIRQLVDKLDLGQHVEFTGFTSAVAEELATLDIMALPSLYGEGLPMVVLEAMAAGVPVVASRVEGATAAIQHLKTGMLVEPNNPEQLAQTLAAFANNHIDHSTMAAAAMARHAEYYSDVTMARGMAALYREVLAEARV
ncbi:glycosyltransferase [Aeoliella mucimassa]|uniref:D-inositol 3-phosphate glycosyltransferase n=1 Tax=Aeoliella mucimassa TaxID=2527972 RepID=A0A518ATT5_9BACT|nr:glycosyltransferase [Aeoliella mucimassa]QDU58140.1 D-inositol 3-phosphate glycosyltransferase [Aeoliella mucimassa]